MEITLSFTRTYGTPELEVVTIHAETAEEASEVLGPILAELYTKYGAGVSITQTVTVLE